MAESVDSLVVVVTHGPHEETSSIAFTVANGGITSGLNVAIFLTGAGVDVVRRRAADATHAQPLEPLKSLVEDFIARGGEPLTRTLVKPRSAGLCRVSRKARVRRNGGSHFKNAQRRGWPGRGPPEGSSREARLRRCVRLT